MEKKKEAKDPRENYKFVPIPEKYLSDTPIYTKWCEEKNRKKARIKKQLRKQN